MIICTYGGSGDNCFVTRVTADSFIQATYLFYGPWLVASTPTQEKALIMATANINAQHWTGEKFFFFQPLAFPRVPSEVEFPWGAFSRTIPDESFFNYLEFSEFQRLMRMRVEKATAAQALWILKNGGEDPYREDQMRGIRSRSKGMRFSESWRQEEPSHVLCPESWDELKYYRASGPSIARGGAAPIRYAPE